MSFFLPAIITLRQSCLLNSFPYEFVIILSHIELLLVLRRVFEIFPCVWMSHPSVSRCVRRLIWCFLFGAACRHRLEEVAAARQRGDQGWTVDGRHRPQPGTRRQSAGECPISKTGWTFAPRGRWHKSVLSADVLFSCLVIIKMLAWIWYTLIGGLKCQAHGAAVWGLNVNQCGLIPKKSTLHTLVTNNYEWSTMSFEAIFNIT